MRFTNPIVVHVYMSGWMPLGGAETPASLPLAPWEQQSNGECWRKSPLVPHLQKQFTTPTLFFFIFFYHEHDQPLQQTLEEEVAFFSLAATPRA